MICDYEIIKTLIETLIPKETFWQSQWFAALVGGFVGFMGTGFLNFFHNKREDKIHLRDKREELYEQMYEFVMRYEKDARTYKSNKYISEDTRDCYNEIEPQTIWATVKIREQFYSLFGEIMESAKSYRKHWDETSEKNRKKILDFKEQIRKELGLKDQENIYDR